MTVVKEKSKKAILFLNLSTWSGMLALFFNPMGFDLVQYQLLKLTGSLWRANFVLYCFAAAFGILSIFLRRKYNKLS